MTMACIALGEDRAGRDVESNREGGGAMANVIVGHSLHVTESHGQRGLGPVESLNLSLLIDRENDSVVRRLQIEPNHIACSSMRNGSPGQLEVLAVMRLNGKRSADTMNS